MAGYKAFGIPATANVSQTDHRVSILGKHNARSCKLLRKSVTAFALTVEFLMASLLFLISFDSLHSSAATSNEDFEFHPEGT